MTLKIEIDVTGMSASEVLWVLKKISITDDMRRESPTVLKDDKCRPCGSIAFVETLFGVPIGSDPR